MDVVQIRGIKKLSFENGGGFAGCIYELENGDCIRVTNIELDKIAKTGEARIKYAFNDTLYMPVVALTGAIYMIEEFIRVEGLVEGFVTGEKYIDNLYRTLTFRKHDPTTQLYYFEYFSGSQAGAHSLRLTKGEVYDLQMRKTNE